MYTLLYTQLTENQKPADYTIMNKPSSYTYLIKLKLEERKSYENFLFARSLKLNGDCLEFSRPIVTANGGKSMGAGAKLMGELSQNCTRYIKGIRI